MQQQLFNTVDKSATVHSTWGIESNAIAVYKK